MEDKQKIQKHNEFEAQVEAGIKADKVMLEIDGLIPMFEHLRENKKEKLNKYVTSLYSMLNN